MRIADRQVLHLIRMWLEAPVVETDDRGRRNESPQSGQGTPQGGVISPLLANIYLHWFEKCVPSAGGPGHVGQGEDRPLCGRLRDPGPLPGHAHRRVDRRNSGRSLPLDDQPREDPRGAAERTGGELGLPGLHVPVRTRPVRPRTIAICGWNRRGRPKRRLREKIREQTGPQWGWMPLPTLIGRLNQTLRGWQAYFRHGHPQPRVLSTRWLPAEAAVAAPASPQSTSLPRPAGRDAVRPLAAPRPAIPHGLSPALCMPHAESSRVSRMREIRPSGLMRGEADLCVGPTDIAPQPGKP